MAKINIMAMRYSALHASLLLTIKSEFLEKQGLHPVHVMAIQENPAYPNVEDRDDAARARLV